MVFQCRWRFGSSIELFIAWLVHVVTVLLLPMQQESKKQWFAGEFHFRARESAGLKWWKVVIGFSVKVGIAQSKWTNGSTSNVGWPKLIVWWQSQLNRFVPELVTFLGSVFINGPSCGWFIIGWLLAHFGGWPPPAAGSASSTCQKISFTNARMFRYPSIVIASNDLNILDIHTQ